MSDPKISELTELTDPADDDFLPIVDTSDGDPVTATKLIYIETLREALLNDSIAVRGFDDFTEDMSTAWVIDSTIGATVTQNPSATGLSFPSSGVAMLGVTNTAGAVCSAYRTLTGLSLDTTIPIVLQFRTVLIDATVYSDDETSWTLGISDHNIGSESSVALHATWTTGPNTRTHTLEVTTSGSVTASQEVTLPTLGEGETGYHFRFEIAPDGVLLQYGIDAAPWTTIGSLTATIPTVTYCPYMINDLDADGAADRTLLVDWVSWSAARHASVVGNFDADQTLTPVLPISGTYTPTFTPAGDIAIDGVPTFSYTRIGDTVSVIGYAGISSAGGAEQAVSLTLPPISGYANTAYGSYESKYSETIRGIIQAVGGEAQLVTVKAVAGVVGVVVSFTYILDLPPA